MMTSFKGNAYLALGEYEKAIACYNFSVQHKQNILEELKTHPKLIEVSGGERSSNYNGTMADMHYSIADCKIYLGQLDEALTEINTALDLIPDLPEFHKESYFNLKGIST